jgi:hypothetical protein
MLGLVLAVALSTQCTDLCSPAAVLYYADLLQHAGYGQLPVEHAAFLIRESDGSLTTEPWRDSGHRRVRFRGAIPPNTIAVVHTHPKDAPLPSVHDRIEARKIDLPVLVVTPAGVAAAFPDGRLVQLVDGSRF